MFMRSSRLSLARSFGELCGHAGMAPSAASAANEKTSAVRRRILRNFQTRGPVSRPRKSTHPPAATGNDTTQSFANFSSEGETQRNDYGFNITTSGAAKRE